MSYHIGEDSTIEDMECAIEAIHNFVNHLECAIEAKGGAEASPTEQAYGVYTESWQEVYELYAEVFTVEYYQALKSFAEAMAANAADILHLLEANPL